LRRTSSSSSSGTAKPAATPDELPEQFGRYRILQRLGQGGMGAVYLAEDTQLQRRVALKVASYGAQDSPEARQRLLAEARAAATLDHPYLCRVHDVGESDGRLYLTMAYIEGQSLAESTRGKSLPQRQVAALVGKLALALQEAHARGVIHRDLKPSNIMIKAAGARREPVIVDFGLARREDANQARLTKTGQVMGTLDYMAPEQLGGDPRAIGPACDIYALGVILYELLTGQLPFEGTALAVVGKILTQAPLPPSSLRPDLDPRLEAICLTAMAKNVSDRFVSMGALASSLTEYLRAPAPDARPTPAAPAPSDPAPPRAGSDTLVARLLDGVASDPAPAPPAVDALPPALAHQPDATIKRQHAYAATQLETEADRLQGRPERAAGAVGDQSRSELPIAFREPEGPADEPPLPTPRRWSWSKWLWPGVAAGVLLLGVLAALLSGVFVGAVQADRSAERIVRREPVDAQPLSNAVPGAPKEPTGEAPKDAAKPPVVSRFAKNNAEGWYTRNQDGSKDATWDFHVDSNKDNAWLVAIDQRNPKEWGWHAPRKFHGDHSDKLGRFLRYSIFTTASGRGSQNTDWYVRLTGGGIVVFVDGRTLQRPIQNQWKAYRVRLDASGGWKIVKPGGQIARATDEDIKQVLSNVTDLRIKGEYGFASLGCLDNVVFGALN
jgi:predicted Ser/Thr protein kinase